MVTSICVSKTPLELKPSGFGGIELAYEIHPRGKKMNAKNILIATTAAMLLMTGAVNARAEEMSANGKQVTCFGINSCKGHGSCKTAANDCKGHNACKGQGNTMTSAEDCTAKGGKVVEASK
jgi:hypothetical protein